MSVSASALFPRRKAASLGGDQEGAFEQAFASLGYGYVRDKAPKLLDYLVGFQLVDRNEDNTKAVGIFGFQLGDQWAYAPVFFVNSNIKGHELLYLKDKDVFVPLKENWVNYVLAKKQQILGAPEQQNLRSLGVRQPDYQSLGMPPVYKQSAVNRWAEWARPFAPALGTLTTDNPLTLKKYAGLDNRLSLKSLLKQSFRLAKLAYDTSEAYPVIGDLLTEYYGDDFFRDVFSSLQQKVKAAENKSALFSQPKAKPSFELFATVKKAAPEEKVRIRIEGEDGGTAFNGPELDEREAERMLQDGYIVDDARDPHEISVVYNTQVELRLTNPDETGLYEVLTKPSAFQKCLIISAPHHCRGRLNGVAVMRMSPKKWALADRSAIFTKPNDNLNQVYRDWFKDQSSSTSLSSDRTYIAVTENGDGTCPFRVRESLGDNRYRVCFEKYKDFSAPHYMPPLDIDNNGDGSWSYDYQSDQIVEISTRKGTKFRSLQGTLYIPDGAKIMAVDTHESDDDYDADASRLPLDPGNLADVKLELLKTAAVRPLRIFADGLEASINRGPMMSKRAALFSLIRQHGLREPAARQVIKEAEKARFTQHRAADFYVKYADAYGDMYQPQQGPYNPSYAPAMPDPVYGMEGAYNGVPSIPSQESYQQIPDLSGQMTDPSIYDNSPDALPDPGTMQMAQQAGQTGQKEVFETSMMTGLLKAVRQDTIVDQYLGDLLKALDRIGRLIFSFHWHNEEFADRYGKADMPELEDTLRNNFDSLGDLTLFLEEKSITTSDRMAGPRIDEAAGN